jgi:hypothetical protein
MWLKVNNNFNDHFPFHYIYFDNKSPFVAHRQKPTLELEWVVMVDVGTIRVTLGCFNTEKKAKSFLTHLIASILKNSHSGDAVLPLTTVFDSFTKSNP